MIYLASDHDGFELKEHLKEFLKQFGKEFVDLGPSSFNKGDDYPDFGILVAEKVAEDPKNNLGLLVCDTGIGMDILANKFKGVRASLCANSFMAERSKQHNNANVLVLGAEITGRESSKEILKLWLETPFSGEERHVRRLGKIEPLGEKK